MRPARVPTAVLVGVFASVVSWIALDTWTGSGRNPPPLSWSAVVGVVALVVAVIATGLPVRRWVSGRRVRRLDPLVAARTAVLAKAASYGGAGLSGWYVGQAAVILPDLIGARRERFAVAVLAAGACVALSAAGFVVQRWCRVPPDDEDSQGAPHSGVDPVR